jgi:hypothetical protein
MGVALGRAVDGRNFLIEEGPTLLPGKISAFHLTDVRRELPRLKIK